MKKSLETENNLIFHPCSKCNSEDYKDFEVPACIASVFDRIKEVTPIACDVCSNLKCEDENCTYQ